MSPKTVPVQYKETPKILIVDDREAELDVLSRILAEFKATIFTAKSGQQALSLLLRHNFILVLLDVKMSEMDGLETARLMRSNKQTENIPIIFMTAYGQDDLHVLQGYKLGAIDYLFKPINVEILRSKVDIFLRSYSYEKEKEYEKLLRKLEAQNKNLQKAQDETLRMMEDANKARNEAEQARKQLEEQARELLRYNKELEQFAYVATHDMRAPLINLSGFLEIFRKRGYVTEENKVIVNKIFSSAARMHETLHDLIAVIAFRKTLIDDVKKIRFGQMVEEVIGNLEDQITEEGAEVSYDFAKAPEIWYVPGHLRSILQNLLSNAVKYRAPDRKPKISVRTERKGPFVHLSVTDNGMGIEPSKHNKVFGLFQRLTDKGEGKGMGLFIIKSQVESLGGSVNFESTPGKGTTFHIHLKNLSRPPKHKRNAPKAPASQHPGH